MSDIYYKDGIMKPSKESYEEYLRIDGEEERYVAMLDIMGFKHMIETMPSNDIYKLLCNADAVHKHLCICTIRCTRISPEKRQPFRAAAGGL